MIYNSPGRRATSNHGGSSDLNETLEEIQGRRNQSRTIVEDNQKDSHQQASRINHHVVESLTRNATNPYKSRNKEIPRDKREDYQINKFSASNTRIDNRKVEEPAPSKGK